MTSLRISSLYNPLTVVTHPWDTVAEAAHRMTSNDVGSCAVLHDGKLVGIITERDLTRSVADAADPSNAKVEDYMTPEPATVDIDADAREAAQTMMELGIRHLPVTHEDEFIGLVSIRDILVELTWSQAI